VCRDIVWVLGAPLNPTFWNLPRAVILRASWLPAYAGFIANVLNIYCEYVAVCCADTREEMNRRKIPVNNILMTV
jgi:hypothetical protein